MEAVVLEGSQWTQLETYTGPVGDHPLWICRYLEEAPHHVINMHKDFLASGSDLLLALTYQLSIEGLQDSYKLSVEEAMGKFGDAVALARTAWQEHVKDHPKDKNKVQLVGGSCGPYGAAQHDGSEYTGSYVDTIGEDALLNWHRPRVKALVDAGVDFLVFETLPSVVEARAAVRLLREFPNTKAWVSFSSQDGLNTCRKEPFGVSFLDIWQRGQGQLLAVGCNCLQPQFVAPLLEQVRALSKEPIPLVAYPNSGETYSAELGWHGKRLNLGDFTRVWLDSGVK